jgi:IS1 family transposase/transposase-like protein
MIPMAPAQERYTTFSCPNPDCRQFNRPNTGHIGHRSWTGKHQHIERLRCTACDREFSEREGTLMARSKLSEDTVERLVKCQRWGVCDEGTADICAVDLKTVYRFQRVAAQRAKTHHQQVVRDVDVSGVQLDEAHSKLRPKQVEWVHTALAMGSWFLLWVDFGPRTQDTAAALIAQVVARARQLPLFLTDGWKAYTAALLQVVGVVYRPRRRGHVGRKPKPRLVAPKALFYAQVVKVRNKTGQVMEVRRRVVYGGPRRFVKQLRLRQLGKTIQTAFMERWYGTLRGLVAPLRRRTRCLSWSRTRHRGKVWLLVSLYNFVMPHKSLRQGRTPRTPAIALGLTDHVWSYREYIWLPVHTDPALTKQMDERMAHLLTPALQNQPSNRTQGPAPPVETREEKEKEAAPLPKAA